MTNSNHTCRFCGTGLRHVFADLGLSPLANSYLKAEQLDHDEAFYPLVAYVCDRCFLVQLPVFRTSEEIFSDYAYFSSYSESWLNHAKTYAESVSQRFDLGTHSLAVEIASNDGYLLQNFVQKNIPVLGIEPAQNVAEAAAAKNIPTITEFFGSDLAKRLVDDDHLADLLIGNNVLAHTPSLNDFVEGMAILLKPHGVITMEFPHLMKLMAENQFDTIYHEHFSYFSFTTVRKIFAAHGLDIFDVEELGTHGGSLRIYACHTEDKTKTRNTAVEKLLNKENNAGFNDLLHYLSFDEQIRKIKRDTLTFISTTKKSGKTIAAYGAPAKGNTLLNYCGITRDSIDYTVDLSPHKQGLLLPGTHIPIFGPEKIRQTKPSHLIILPWNLKDEIQEQMSYIREWGGKFVTLIPEVRIF